MNPPTKSGRFGTFLFLFCAVCLAAIGLLHRGAALLVSRDDTLGPADVAVVLEGSITAEKVRLNRAMQLLGSRTVSNVLVGIPKESYWGQEIAPVARSYIQNHYGQSSAAETFFCEAGSDVNSTQQEADVLVKCIEAHAWHTVVLVTSDYHTRRARLIWKRKLHQHPGITNLSVDGVNDPDFHASGWWKDRLSAKTWAMESEKLLWTLVTP